jgi:hypothetical protein
LQGDDGTVQRLLRTDLLVVTEKVTLKLPVAGLWQRSVYWWPESEPRIQPKKALYG